MGFQLPDVNEDSALGMLPPDDGLDGQQVGVPGGASGASDELYSGLESEGGKQLLSGPALIIVIIAVAGGALFGMRKMGLGADLAIADVTIDYPFDEQKQSKSVEDHQKLLTDLRNSGQVVQVPLNSVQMNPFEWRGGSEMVEAQAVEPIEDEDPTARAERLRQQRLQDLRRRVASLKLAGVMGGRVPMARINGELAQVGDTIDDDFVVAAIEGRRVTLEAMGERFELNIMQP
ncbi:MAG: hypothetical protein AAGD00_01125 [Planctomycetota bacterium]